MPSRSAISRFSLSRSMLLSAAAPRDPESLFLLTSNIALKSITPRRVRPEPEEAPGLSATTMVFFWSRTNTKKEEKNGFSLFAKGKHYLYFSIPSLSMLSIIKAGEQAFSTSLSTRSHHRREAPQSHTYPLPPPPPNLHLHLRSRRSQTAPCRASMRAPPR